MQCAREERRWREKTATERADEGRTDARGEAGSTAHEDERAGQRREGGGARTVTRTGSNGEVHATTRKNAANADRARA